MDSIQIDHIVEILKEYEVGVLILIAYKPVAFAVRKIGGAIEAAPNIVSRFFDNQSKLLDNQSKTVELLQEISDKLDEKE
tara:strand:- start:91 stop:330 length:240 start_codon:yes stop_codon:yes gene_type:complete